MSNGKLNIVVSGGNANFGNVSQGDANTNVVESQKIDARAEQAFAEFFQELERRRLPIQLEQAAQPPREAAGRGWRRRSGCLP
jgi:hypothetical protein